MSVLLALDESIEMRSRVHGMCKSIKASSLDKNAKEELLDVCYRLYDQVQEVVRTLETSLLPPNTSAAITFYPFTRELIDGTADNEPRKVAEEEADYTYRTPRKAGDRRGTFIIPSTPPDENEL